MKNKQMMIVVIAIVIILGLSYLLGKYKTNIQEIIKKKVPWINQLVKNKKNIESQEQDSIEDIEPLNKFPELNWSKVINTNALSLFLKQNFEKDDIYSEDYLNWYLNYPYKHYCSLQNSNKNSLTSVIKKDNNIIGSATIKPIRFVYEGYPLNSYLLNFLCVDKKYRKKGLAPILMNNLFVNNLNNDFQTFIFKMQKPLPQYSTLCQIKNYSYDIPKSSPLDSIEILEEVSLDNLNDVIDFIGNKTSEYLIYNQWTLEEIKYLFINNKYLKIVFKKSKKNVNGVENENLENEDKNSNQETDNMDPSNFQSVDISQLRDDESADNSKHISMDINSIRQEDDDYKITDLVIYSLNSNLKNKIENKAEILALYSEGTEFFDLFISYLNVNKVNNIMISNIMNNSNLINDKKMNYVDDTYIQMFNYRVDKEIDSSDFNLIFC